jgi:hypothetical protein
MRNCNTEERRVKQRAWIAACRAKRRAIPELYEADRARDRQYKADKRAAAGKPPREKKPKVTKEERYRRSVEVNRIRIQRMKEEDPARYRVMLDRLAERRRTKGVRVKVLTEEQHQRRMETQRNRRRAALAASPVAAPRPTGSVVVTAAPSAWRDVLAALGRMVPRIDEREDIIAEAALLAVQGLDLAEAVRQAKRSVSAGARFYRYTKPIEDCQWI